MTTPPSDESAGTPAPGAPPPDEAPAPPPSAPPPVPPPSAAPPPPWLAPVPRAPRVLWINPARRVHVIGAAAVAGLVLLGAGIGIGWGTSGDGHDHRGGYRLELGPGYFPQGPRGALLPHRFPAPLGPPKIAPTPAPSATK